MFSRRVTISILLGLVLSFSYLYCIERVDFRQSYVIGEKFIPSENRSLEFSTYIGGISYDYITDMAIDINGNIYLVGTTTSTDFPTTDGAYDTSHNGGSIDGPDDIFVMKIGNNGRDIIYSTFLGGSGDERGYGIEVDEEGCAYIVGKTDSDDFPIVNSYDDTLSSGYDCFVTKFSPNGSELEFSTYIGGSGEEHPKNLVVDNSGNVIVVGVTSSTDFPVNTSNSQSTCHSLGGSEDAFVFKLSNDGSSLIYSMYIGGTETTDDAQGVVVDCMGNVVIVGSTGSTNFPKVDALDDTLDGVWDAYITKLNESGHFIFSTYYGGSGIDGADAVHIDDCQNIYITGITKGGSFPRAGVHNEILNGTWGLFLVVMNSTGNDVEFSGVLKESGAEDYSTSCSGLIVQSEQEIWIAGSTEYANFPTTDDAFDDIFNNQDGYLVMIDPLSCTLNYSSFYGGASDDSISGIAVTSSEEIICSGATTSSEIPLKNAIISERPGDYDGFVFKIVLNETATGTATSITTSTTSSTYTSMDMMYATLVGASLGVVILAIVVVFVKRSRPS